MNPATHNVYLVGPMGSGKTTIGQRLAIELDLEFLDCDRELEARTGASVNLIFDVEGEKGFRVRESEMLHKLASRSGVLIATGGGTVLLQVNRDLLKRSGTVVYLQTSVPQQLARLSRDNTRPLLQSPDRQSQLRLLAELRNPLYEGVADIRYRASGRSIAQSTTRLAQMIRCYWENKPVQRVEPLKEGGQESKDGHAKH